LPVANQKQRLIHSLPVANQKQSLIHRLSDRQPVFVEEVIMTDKLRFYRVDKEYRDYLHSFDDKIPTIDYGLGHEKFLCGIVFDNNGIKYFAPVSSFKTQQKTNILLYDKVGVAISSIRLCFMFPVPENKVTVANFSDKDDNYNGFISKEIKSANAQIEQIKKIADIIYKQRTKEVPSNFYITNCCDFKLLETKCAEYML
jgi:protein AbiQ